MKKLICTLVAALGLNECAR